MTAGKGGLPVLHPMVGEWKGRAWAWAWAWERTDSFLQWRGKKSARGWLRWGRCSLALWVRKPLPGRLRVRGGKLLRWIPRSIRADASTIPRVPRSTTHKKSPARKGGFGKICAFASLAVFVPQIASEIRSVHPPPIRDSIPRYGLRFLFRLHRRARPRGRTQAHFAAGGDGTGNHGICRQGDETARRRQGAPF